MNMTNNVALNEHTNKEYDIYFHHKYNTFYSSIYKPYSDRESIIDNPSVVVNTISRTSFNGCSGLMNSSWPMYCHDIRHTGRSSYTTVNATGVVKWTYGTDGMANGGPTIDSNGTIYIGSYELSAVYPNGTLKWKFNAGHSIVSSPAIAEDGTIYFGDIYGYNRLYALNPNGTTKWIYQIGGYIFSSPAIGDDGIIYVGSGDNSIHAIYPNGTRKWKFDTNDVIYSSPTIGADGTIYCGCHDTYLYALYPQNGTMKWKYKTGDWIRTSPCITDDGTIYVVSLDEYLYAVYPNGTMRWKTFCGAGTSPTIGWDGTVYCGGYDLYAINPENGSVKWIYDVPGTLEGGTPCNSIDGTIYLGTWEGGYLIAINPDGTEQWRKSIGSTDSPPAIGADGTVYIGGGYTLYAIGKGPLRVEANGPYSGYAHTPIQFKGTIYGGVPSYNCVWDFGDGTTSTEQNPEHAYEHHGNYTATFSVTDAEGNSSSDIASVIVDYALPMVSIVKPTNALYIMNVRLLPLKIPIILGRITVEVETSQEDGFEITQVEINIDDGLKATLTSEPYAWTWKGFAFGGSLDHYINVCAYDNKGRTNWTSVYVWKFF